MHGYVLRISFHLNIQLGIHLHWHFDNHGQCSILLFNSKPSQLKHLLTILQSGIDFMTFLKSSYDANNYDSLRITSYQMLHYYLPPVTCHLQLFLRPSWIQKLTTKTQALLYKN